MLLQFLKENNIHVQDLQTNDEHAWAKVCAFLSFEWKFYEEDDGQCALCITHSKSGVPQVYVPTRIVHDKIACQFDVDDLVFRDYQKDYSTLPSDEQARMRRHAELMTVSKVIAYELTR